MTRSEVLELRLALKLTRVRFAQWIGVEPITVARWEQGLSPPKSTAEAIMRAALEAIHQATGSESRSRVVSFLCQRARVADLIQDLAVDVARPGAEMEKP